jgi:hypothetical protein
MFVPGDGGDIAESRLLRPHASDPYPATSLEASEMLGISRQVLAQMVRDGIFRQGEEFIKRHPGSRAPRWWSIHKCRERLQEWNKSEAAETYAGEVLA